MLVRVPGKRGHFGDVHQVMGKCESVAEAEKENCMSEVFATFLFLMCCLKQKAGRDIRTRRESIVVENYRRSGVSRKKSKPQRIQSRSELGHH